MTWGRSPIILAVTLAVGSVAAACTLPHTIACADANPGECARLAAAVVQGLEPDHPAIRHVAVGPNLCLTDRERCLLNALGPEFEAYANVQFWDGPSTELFVLRRSDRFGGSIHTEPAHDEGTS